MARGVYDREAARQRRQDEALTIADAEHLISVWRRMHTLPRTSMLYRKMCVFYSEKEKDGATVERCRLLESMLCKRYADDGKKRGCPFCTYARHQQAIDMVYCGK